jgi:hypothetical protein
VIKILQESKMAKSLLVEKKTSGTLYSLKVQRKDKLLEYGLLEQSKLEK